MIRILIAFAFFVPAFAFAGQCDQQINTEIDAEMEARHIERYSVQEADALRVTEIVYQESTELDQGDIDTIMGYVAKKGQYEFYQLTGTADYSAGFQKLYIVEKKSCSTVESEVTYIE